jgi:hypothetical protein
MTSHLGGAPTVSSGRFIDSSFGTSMGYPTYPFQLTPTYASETDEEQLVSLESEFF